LRSLTRRTPRSTLFPYTTLFRSRRGAERAASRLLMDAAHRQELQDLLVRLADGDRAAFPPAFTLLWPVARAFARSFLREDAGAEDRKSTRLNSSHDQISYAVFCL